MSKWKRYCDNSAEDSPETHPRRECTFNDKVCCHFCKKDSCKVKCPNIKYWKDCFQRVSDTQLFLLRLLCKDFSERGSLRDKWRKRILD